MENAEFENSNETFWVIFKHCGDAKMRHVKGNQDEMNRRKIQNYSATMPTSSILNFHIELKNLSFQKQKFSKKDKNDSK